MHQSHTDHDPLIFPFYGSRGTFCTRRCLLTLSSPGCQAARQMAAAAANKRRHRASPAMLKTAALWLMIATAVHQGAEGAQQLSYARDGLDWGGLCVTSHQQSPVNLVASDYTPVQPPADTNMSFGTGTNVSVRNLGNQIRVTWTQAEPSTATTTLGAFYAQPRATGPINITGTDTPAGLAETVLNIVPTQFHFHTTSEHTIEGRFAALETHLVTNVTGANTSCANTCTAVFAVLYDFSADGLTGNSFLDPYLASIPPNVTSNNVTHLPSNFTLNLTDLLPADTSQYVQYTGSLTTPPCSEEISWTIFTETEPISVKQVQTLSDVLAAATFEGFVPQRTDNRLPQPLYNRTLWLHEPTVVTA